MAARNCESLLGRVHQRLVDRANIHICLANEGHKTGYPLEGLEAKVGAGCLALAEVVAKLSSDINHPEIVASYPNLQEQAKN